MGLALSCRKFLYEFYNLSGITGGNLYNLIIYSASYQDHSNKKYHRYLIGYVCFIRIRNFIVVIIWYWES